MSEALQKEYSVSDEIGRGRFGVVFRCTIRNTGENFAVKSIDKSLTAGDSLDAQCLLTEPKILQLLSPHPNVIQIFNVYEDQTHLHMVMELCDGQDLHSRILANGPFPESEAKAVFTQLMRAISHCHQHGVVHRDVKADNILFDGRNSVKLADFGSAAAVAVEGETMSSVVGTPYYVAPEVLAGMEYGEKVDVWSAGVVLYIMLAGFPPFHGETAVEIFGAVLRGNLRFPPRAFHSVSSGLKELLRRMLCKDVSKRLSAEQVLRHQWVTNGG
uniref:Protein kinase domain-containing protein n=1 Tax=Rhizophora mucronata TaxID=61149 RepID=A0A2P2MYD2_RHIMU